LSVKQFSVVEKSLGAAEAQAAARLIAVATDVAIVVDSQGVIRDFSCENDELSSAFDGAWLGRRWMELVTVESRPKIEALLTDAASNAPPRWRHVNHPVKLGPDIPMLYSAVKVGRTDRIMAVGRDLRPMATLQQRLVDAQQSMEREYARLRHAETRYRLLFQVSEEAVLVIDAMNGRVTEANPAAAALLGSSSRRLVGRSIAEGFDAESQRSLESMLAAARTAGRSDDVRARTANGSRDLQLSATLFREDRASFVLLRAAPVVSGAGEAPVGVRSRVLDLVESAPDGFVVTDTDGRVIVANRAFLDMAQCATERQVQQDSLDRWLGRPGIDLSVLMASLREHGSVRLFSTSIRGNYGTSTDVEICAVSASSGEDSCYGFSIRDVTARLPAPMRGEHELPRSVQQMTELVGRVPLKDLVREATDMIERLCIEAALELSSDNRASAAELLGLSRQSLYVKLRRYGLGDLVPPDDLN
jgi:transcriptional regulator PpsR